MTEISMETRERLGVNGGNDEGPHHGDDPPRVLLISGPDMDTRIPFLQALSGQFRVAAAAPKEELRSAFESAGIEFIHYPLRRGGTPLSDLRTLLALCGVIRQWDPHLVHALSSKPAVWGRLAAWMVGVPAIVGTLPGQGSLYLSDRPKVRVLRAIYSILQTLACRVSDMTIVYNQWDERQFVEEGIARSTKTMIIPGSGVSTDRFSPRHVSPEEVQSLRDELGIAPDELVVTLIGRVVRTKGVLEYCSAAERLGARRDDVRFLLVGPRDTASVDRLSEEEWERIDSVLQWTGPRDDIPVILAVTDIFVLPSYAEGIPRALIEAASMGVPLVSTHAPGCSDVVEHESNGLLVEPADDEALERAIEQLLEDPVKRREFGAASRDLARRKYDLEVVARQTIQVYRSLLQTDHDTEHTE